MKDRTRQVQADVGGKQTAEAEQIIKQEAFKQTTAVTTDLVYKAMTADKKIVLQTCDAGGENCKQSYVEAKDVKVIDDKVYVFNNGIMNDERQALATAARQASDAQNQQGVYVIINPYTGNPVAEVLYAAYDKANELTGGMLPISNASEANLDVEMAVRNQPDSLVRLDSINHSRGSLTMNNALAQQVNADDTQAAWGTVLYNGAAANAERAANYVQEATSGQGVVMESTHQDDLIGIVFGQNEVTGGQDMPVIDAHSSYTGSLPPLLNANGEKNPLRQLTDEAWGNEKISQPVIVPASRPEGVSQ